MDLKTIIAIAIVLVCTFGVVRLQTTQCLNDFNAAILRSHNSYRGTHSAPALQQDNGIVAKAQAYAKYLAQYNLFKHSNALGLGENLYKSASLAPFSSNNCASQ